MERLKDLRVRRGYSQQELADLSGVAQHTISEIEIGRRDPQGRTLRKLAAALGATVGDFYAEPASVEEPTLPKATAPPSSDPDEITDEERRDASWGYLFEKAIERGQEAERLMAGEGSSLSGLAGAAFLLEHDALVRVFDARDASQETRRLKGELDELARRVGEATSRMGRLGREGRRQWDLFWRRKRSEGNHADHRRQDSGNSAVDGDVS